ncbi:MAG: Rpp14/Pop5 family protein [Nanoarchaeota archaeon]
MAKIQPSSKERKRYIRIKVDSTQRVEKGDLERTVIQAGLKFLGELNMARAGVQLLSDTWDGKHAIVRTGHKYIDDTIAALALVKDIEGHKATISSIKVSGAVNKLKELRK